MLLVEVTNNELRTICMDCKMYRGCRFVKGRQGVCRSRILCAEKDIKKCLVRINRRNDQFSEHKNKIS